MPHDARIWRKRPSEIFTFFVNTHFTIRNQGIPVATFRPGRIVWWLLIGWLVATPYNALLSAGTGALVCIVALGSSIGLLGSLTALVSGTTMLMAGVTFADLTWWTVPLLIGWLVGAVSKSFLRLVIAHIGLLAVLAVPVTALLVVSKSWLGGLVILVVLIRPHLSFVSETNGLTRLHRMQVWLGAVVWVLAATLLAMGSAGAWFVRLWPSGLFGWLIATVVLTAAMMAVKALYLMTSRGSLAKVTELKGPARLRLHRDRFSGLYGALMGPAWFCVLAAGVFHYHWPALIGSATVMLLSLTRFVLRRIDTPLRYTVDRLDAARYLFSVGSRRAELRDDWLDDFRRTLTALSLSLVGTSGFRQRSASYQRAWLARIRPAFALVEIMVDEGKKTALNDVDDTIWLPFEHTEGRPQLLNVVIRWVDEALTLLDLFGEANQSRLSDLDGALRARYEAWRCDCYHVRGFANMIHGRLEEGMLDHYTAAGICRQLGAVNTEAFMLRNANIVFLRVPIRHLQGRIAELRVDVDTRLMRVTEDERIHPQIRRVIAADMAFQSAYLGKYDLGEQFLQLANAIPLPRPERTKTDHESVYVDDTDVRVTLGIKWYPLPLNFVDYTAFVHGDAALDHFIFTEHPYSPAFLRTVISDKDRIAGYRALRKAITLASESTGVPVTRIDIRDTRPIEAWIIRSEERGGLALAAELREILGYTLRGVDPYRAADHLLHALNYRQSVQFGILDDDLRIAVRGAAEALGDVVIDHVATLAQEPAPDGSETPLTVIALELVRSVKSRALIELMGNNIPAPDDDELIAQETQAQHRYDDARRTGDHQQLREARETLEHCWAKLITVGGPLEEYAALRAGVPIRHKELRDLLAQLAD